MPEFILWWGDIIWSGVLGLRLQYKSNWNYNHDYFFATKSGDRSNGEWGWNKCEPWAKGYNSFNVASTALFTPNETIKNENENARIHYDMRKCHPLTHGAHRLVIHPLEKPVGLRQVVLCRGRTSDENCVLVTRLIYPQRDSVLWRGQKAGVGGWGMQSLGGQMGGDKQPQNVTRFICNVCHKKAE